MHVKWLKHGAGNAKSATAYLLADHDHKGIERAGVEVLRGNPEQVAEVANSLDFSRRYSSGVIAWAREDAPTPAQIQQTLDEFERVTFAGLEADRYAWTAVQHIEQDGSTHVHILVARVDLETGKAFNPAPPGWERTYDPLRDALNLENGWARPDDPARARLVQPGHEALVDAAAIRQGLTTTPSQAKEQITAWLTDRIVDGSITDRAGIAASLAELGEVTRQGKDYISVKLEGFDKAFRLKGAIYGEDFKSDGLGRADQGPDGSRPSLDRGPNIEAARAARAELAAAIQRRTDFNQERYRIRDSEAGKGVDRAGRDDRQAEHRAGELDRQSQEAGGRPRAEAGGRDRGADQATAVADALAAAGDAGRLPADLRRDLGLLDAGQAVQPPADEQRQLPGNERRRLDDVQPRDGSATNQPAMPAGEIKENDGGRQKATNEPTNDAADARGASRLQPWRDSEPDRPGLRASRLAGRERMPDLRERGAGAEQQGPGDSLLSRFVPRLGDLHRGLHRAFSDLKGWYDRTRNQIGERIGAAWESIRSGRAELVAASAGLELAAGRAEQRVSEASGRLDGAARSAGERQRTATAELGQSLGDFGQKAERACRKLSMSREDELTRFKTDVNLVEYACSRGYSVIKSESSKASTVLTDNQGDKVVVATAEDGHGIYFSVRDDADNGSIIDFVQRRQGLNLGQVRKELRPWIGEYGRAAAPVHAARKPEVERPAKPVPSSRDRQQVLAKWMQMEPAAGRHKYLENERHLDRKTLADPRFAGAVRVDGKGNAVFPHFDRDGITGYELKNDGFTGFAKGGEKGLWISSNLNHAERVVIVESAIDAMSHAQAKKDRESAYISIGGSMSDKQRDLLAGALAKAHQRGATVVLATDSDEAGHKLAGEARALAPAGANIERLEPRHGKDWNDEVKYQYGQEHSYGLEM
jgi:hypothetical protein